MMLQSTIPRKCPSVLILALVAGPCSIGNLFAGVPFAKHVVTTGADGAESVYAADVDGDGDLDLLSASVLDDTLAWYENVPASGEFVAHIISTSADGAAFVRAADMDDDGDLDVLSASYNDSSIAWYENDGAPVPSWTQHVVSTNAVQAVAVIAADIDRDGDLDVISASRGDNKIAWYQNDGAAPPQFTEHVITSNALQASAVFAADIDGDGDMDVAAASSADNKIAWHENDGAALPTFSENVVSTMDGGARSVCAADIDHDGDVDLVTARFADNKISWYQNNSAADPMFVRRAISSSAMGPQTVMAVDVNRDGHVDVVATSSLDDTVAWYQNDGASPPSFTEHIVTTDADAARGLFAADVDRDGHLDILSASREDDAIAWYENLRPAPPVPTEFINAEIGIFHLLAAAVPADLNGDGHMDVAGFRHDSSQFRWYVNSGAWPPDFDALIGGTMDGDAKDIEVADLNGDGYLDAVFAYSDPDGSPSGVTWFANNGMDPADFTEYVIDGDLTGSAWDVSVADLDDDGDDDILAARDAPDSPLVWYRNLGGEPLSFERHDVAADAIGVRTVFAADMDGDGDLDALAGSWQHDTITWWENDGADLPSFTGHTISTTAHGVISVFAADLDSDGSMDALSASEGDNRLVWYKNNGASPPAFTSRLIAFATVETGIKAVDIDGDGGLDVLAQRSAAGNFVWYRNNRGNPPTFEEQLLVHPDRQPNPSTSNFAGDLDGNGTIDLLGTYNDTVAASLLVNTAYAPPAFFERLLMPIPHGANAMRAADLDGDKDVDILLVSDVKGDAESQIIWYENGGGRPPVFTEHVIDQTDEEYAFVLPADLNGDGDLDVVVGIHSCCRYIVWYENEGGSPPTFHAPRQVANTLNSAEALFAADVDGDGQMDLLAASAGDMVAWYKNNGAQTPMFAEHAIPTTANGPRAVLAADVNGDGMMDVVSGSVNDGKVIWYENDGAVPPAFLEHVIATSMFDAQSLVAVDLDEDGDIDVVTQDGHDVYWLSNNGEGSPTFSQQLLTTAADIHGLHERVLAVDDLDGDSDLDIVLSSDLEIGVAWLENDGATPPTFELHYVLGRENYPFDLVLADIDGDLDLDILDATGFVSLLGDDYQLRWFENLMPAFVDSSSVRAHGPEQIELRIDLEDSHGIEPRQGGLQLLLLQTNSLLDANTVTNESVMVTCDNQDPDYSVGLYDERTIEVTFDAGPTGDTCCSVSMNVCTSVGVPLQATRPVIALAGDLNFSGGVTGGDAVLIKAHFGEIAGVDLDQPMWDFDQNGGVTGADFALIKPLFGNLAPACP